MEAHDPIRGRQRCGKNKEEKENGRRLKVDD
jgi:hypothetical protein